MLYSDFLFQKQELSHGLLYCNCYGYLQDAFGTWSALYLSHDHMLVKLFSPGGGGDSHMKQTGMLVVSLRGVNFGFWSRLGCSGQRANILSQFFCLVSNDLICVFPLKIPQYDKVNSNRINSAVDLKSLS